MRRRGVLIGVWLVATGLATLVAWGAVRQVTDQVSPTAVLPLPSAVAIADEPDVQPTAGATPDRPRRRRNQVADLPTEPRPESPRPAEPTDQEVSANPPNEETRPGGQNADEETGNNTQAQPATTEAYELVGGVVTVRYDNGTVRLVSATPNSGFDVDVNEGGPDEVDVRFRSDSHESRLETRWRDGRPDPEREEEPR